MQWCCNRKNSLQTVFLRSIPHICLFFYTNAIWGQKSSCNQFLFKILHDIKQFFSRSNWKIIRQIPRLTSEDISWEWVVGTWLENHTLVWFFCTTSSCDGCEKHRVCFEQHMMIMRSSNPHLNPNLNPPQWLWSRKILQQRVWLFRLLKNILTRTRAQRLEIECLEYLLVYLKKYLNKSKQSALDSFGTDNSILNF